MSYTVTSPVLNCSCCSDDHTPPTCTTVTEGLPPTVHVRYFSPLYSIEFDANWDPTGGGGGNWHADFPNPVNIVLCQDDDGTCFQEVRFDAFFVAPPTCNEGSEVPNWAAEFAHDGTQWTSSISGEGPFSEGLHMGGGGGVFTVNSLFPLHLTGVTDGTDCFCNAVSIEITVPPPPMPMAMSAPEPEPPQPKTTTTIIGRAWNLERIGEKDCGCGKKGKRKTR